MTADDRGMTLIVKTVTRLALGFMLLYGVYIALAGHSACGGGFAGGIIVALAFVQMVLAFGKNVALRRLRSHTLRVTISAGALVFLFAAASGIPGRFFNNGIVMPLCEMIIVGGGLFAIFIALVLLSKADRNSE
jgi:multicomponent Na+:H+ antiporter subunit B